MGPLILTNIGLAKLASATPENQLEIKSVAVGDSDAPIDPTNTALNNEVWRGDSSLPIRDPMDAKVLIFEGVIPASVGGFTIREVGLFDVDGDLIAIGHTSEIDKPAPSAGTPITLTARVRLMLDNADQTDLIIADAPLIDHQGTGNRDAPDAHPIEAITGLTAELGLKANTADLGQGAFFDEASTLQAQVLTAGNRFMTPRRVADALNAQDWRQYSASRSTGTTYTNTDNRPIFVSVQVLGKPSTDLKLYAETSNVNGFGRVAAIEIPRPPGSEAPMRGTLFFVVRGGGQYRVSDYDSTVETIEIWDEFRL